MQHAHNTEFGYEPDVQSKQMTTIGIYFVTLTALFFGCVFGLFVYFRYETDMAIARKVVPNPVMQEGRSAAQGKLAPVPSAMQAITAEQAAHKGKTQ